MKKNKFLYALCMPLLILGCTDNSDEITNPTVEFVSIGTGFREADGSRTVVLPLRNFDSSPFALADVVISGSATAGQDYDITGITAEGIQINLKDDDLAEYIETIQVRIPGTAGNLVHTVTLASDDPGYIDIDLTWEAGIDAVDMDMILWKLDENDKWEQIDESWGSTFEHLNIDWKDDDGTYGLTYNFYSGNVNPLNFTAKFTPTGVTVAGALDPLVYNVVYTTANKDKSGNYQIVQTFKKKGTVFSDFTSVTVPTSGSRVGSFLHANFDKAAALNN